MRGKLWEGAWLRNDMGTEWPKTVAGFFAGTKDFAAKQAMQLTRLYGIETTRSSTILFDAGLCRTPQSGTTAIVRLS
jgi:hypothetical protein